MAQYLLLAAASLFRVSAAASSPDCSCWTTNNTNGSAATWTHYNFYDFRSLSSDDSKFEDAPPLITADQNNGTEDVTSDYFSSDDFTSVWNIQNWSSKPITNGTEQDAYYQVVNSPQNIYISRDDTGNPTHITLRTSRLEDFQSSAEMDTVQAYTHASFRVRARISGDSGAVAGLFLYNDDENESDIEILTRDDESIWRASNQPDVGSDGNDVPGASTLEPVTDGGDGNSTWTDWVVYRHDWLPDRSDWWINGEKVASKTYGVPRKDCTLDLNLWGNGGMWSGNMTVGGVATMDIEWIEVAWNGTAADGGDDGDCSSGGTVCDVDQEAPGSGDPVASGCERTKLSPRALLMAPLVWFLT